MAVFNAYALARATDRTACVLDFDASLKTYAEATSIFTSDATYSITIDDLVIALAISIVNWAVYRAY